MTRGDDINQGLADHADARDEQRNGEPCTDLYPCRWCTSEMEPEPEIVTPPLRVPVVIGVL